MKNKLKYTKHKWIDLFHDQFPKSFLKKITGLEAYQDKVFKEHIYSMETLKDNFEFEDIVLSKEESEIFDKIGDYAAKEDTAYFRIVYL